MRRFLIGGLVALVAVMHLVSVAGCSSASINPTSFNTDDVQQELYAEYRSGDASLSLLAAGDWDRSDVDVLLTYRSGTEERVLVVNFQHWRTYGDSAVPEFIKAMDPALTLAALGEIRDAHENGLGVSDREEAFRHIQARLLTSTQSQTPATPGLTTQIVTAGNEERGEECYCIVCKKHHPANCYGEASQE